MDLLGRILCERLLLRLSETKDEQQSELLLCLGNQQLGTDQQGP